jgi:hypothetical protein
MSDLSMGYVLVCHAPADRGYADDLCRQLRARHIRARFDERGAETEQLVKLARRADALLVVMTPAAHGHQPLSEQIKAARGMDVPIYPLAVDDNQPLLELTDQAHLWRTARGERLEDNLLGALARDVGAPVDPARGKYGLPAVIGASAAAVVLAVVATVLVVGMRGGKTEPPSPGATTARAASTAAPGQVTIASPGDGAVVKKCERFSGAAALAATDTIMFAVNRVSPPDKAWYYGYLGSYQNGSVPAAWTGDVYFGSATSQKYDVFVYVMGVEAAHKFWDAHKSKDGSFAFGKGAPTGVKPAAHVRVTQGSLDEC